MLAVTDVLGASIASKPVPSIRMFGDAVLVRVLDQKKMVGSLALPENTKYDMNRGVIVAVGCGKFAENGPDPTVRVPMECKVGDIVLLGGQGDPVIYNDEALLLYHDWQLFAAIDPAD